MTPRMPGTLTACVLVACLAATPLLAPAGSTAGRQYALLVACSDYNASELKKLPFAVREMAEFRDALLASGLDPADVKFLRDRAEELRYWPTAANIRRELDLLLARAEPGDTAIVVLNGHGLQFKGDKSGYFCPLDAEVARRETLLPMEAIFSRLQKCKATRKLLIANACRNDPLSDPAQAASKVELVDDYENVPEGIAALYSCAPGQRSYYYPPDQKRPRSLFMHHLIEAWRGRYVTGPTLSLEDVFSAVRTKTMRDADELFARPQQPQIKREYRGDWVIARAPAAKVPAVPAPPAKTPAVTKAPPGGRRACIIVWLGGGPSQIDLFDPKPGHPNGALVPAIDTAIKGVKFGAHLPQLAKQAGHLAVIRTVTHRFNDHVKAKQLMLTGREPPETFPSLGCVLARELGDKLTDRPRHICLGAYIATPDFLEPRFGAVLAPERAGRFELPTAEAFDVQVPGKGKVLRSAVLTAFNLGPEPEVLRNAYGRGSFGQSCLLARRLVEAGVPVVGVTLGGWDMHKDIPGALHLVAGQLDAGLATLIRDLAQRKLLDSTLVLCVGEIGRTPTINPNKGRDHWSRCGAAVLAGRGIKGGQVIGVTSADGTQIVERPVTPPELLATVYQALGIDPATQYPTPDGVPLALVPAGTGPVKEALR